MFEIGDSISPGRDPHIAHVTAHLAEHFNDWIFEPVLAPDLTDDGELRAVRRPVGLPHAFFDFARGPAVQGHARQGAGKEPVPDVPCTHQNRELTLGGDGEQLHSGWAERRWLGITGTHRVNLRRISRDRGAIDDGVFVGEGGLKNGFAPEVQLAKGNRLRSAPGEWAAEQGGQSEGGKHRSQCPRKPGGAESDGRAPGGQGCGS